MIDFQHSRDGARALVSAQAASLGEPPGSLASQSCSVAVRPRPGVAAAG
jgi:hypothetical protein